MYMNCGIILPCCLLLVDVNMWFMWGTEQVVMLQNNYRIPLQLEENYIFAVCYVIKYVHTHVAMYIPHGCSPQSLTVYSTDYMIHMSVVLLNYSHMHHIHSYMLTTV